MRGGNPSIPAKSREASQVERPLCANSGRPRMQRRRRGVTPDAYYDRLGRALRLSLRASTDDISSSRSRALTNGFIIGNRSPPRPFEVIVLSVLERPEKPHQADEAERQRQRNQDYQ